MDESVLVAHPHPGTAPPGRDVFDDIADVLARQRVDAAANLALLVRACDEVDLCMADVEDDRPAPDAGLGLDFDLPDEGTGEETTARWRGGERWVRVGADGTPYIAEFVVLQLQALYRCTVPSMRARLANALNLRHRHPLLWDAVQSLHIADWQAHTIVAECLRAGLGAQESLLVDAWLAEGVELLGWGRARRLLRGLIVRADPALAAERAAAKRQVRGVWTSPMEDGQVTIEARLDGVDGLAVEAQLARIAKHLAADARADGLEPDPLDQRRARALAMLATPHLAAAYLEDHTRPGEPHAAVEDVLAPVPRLDPDKLRPSVKLFLHLHADDVTAPDADGVIPSGSGVVRIEGHGPVDLASLHHVLRGSLVRIQPVIDLNAPPATDRYEVPDRLREHLFARNPYDILPWSATESRFTDLDHTVEYDWGDPEGAEQTRADNLGPLSRLAHRGKTHAPFTLEQLKPGVFWYTTPAGFQYLVTPNGTMAMGRHPDGRRIADSGAPRPTTAMREGPAQPPPRKPTDVDPTEPAPY